MAGMLFFLFLQANLDPFTLNTCNLKKTTP